MNQSIFFCRIFLDCFFIFIFIFCSFSISRVKQKIKKFLQIVIYLRRFLFYRITFFKISCVIRVIIITLLSLWVYCSIYFGFISPFFLELRLFYKFYMTFSWQKLFSQPELVILSTTDFFLLFFTMYTSVYPLNVVQPVILSDGFSLFTSFPLFIGIRRLWHTNSQLTQAFKMCISGKAGSWFTGNTDTHYSAIFSLSWLEQCVYVFICSCEGQLLWGSLTLLLFDCEGILTRPWSFLVQ